MFLTLWFLSTLKSTQKSNNPQVRGLLYLAGFGAVLLTIGRFLTDYPVGAVRPPALRDSLAYVFCMSMAINYARLADKNLASLSSGLVLAYVFSLLLAIILGIIARDWSGLDGLSSGVRWQQLSANPNQLALLAFPLPFLIFHALLNEKRRKHIVRLALGFLAVVGSGLYSDSDALTTAWILGGLTTLMALRSPKKDGRSGASSRAAVRGRQGVAILILLMLATSCWNWRDKIAEVVTRLSPKVNAPMLADPTPSPAPTSDKIVSTPVAPAIDPAVKGQTDIRFHIWRNSLKVLYSAPFAGLGPGAHSGIYAPYQGAESHNIILEWGTQTGVLGALILIAYLSWVLWQVARCRQYELTALVLGLYCFSMFHSTLRQPLFWILPLIAWDLAARAKENMSLNSPPAT
jgi:hypothetical protein